MPHHETAYVPFHALAQNDPFPPEKWPASVKRTAKVHFISVGDTLPAPGAGWQPTLQVLSGGDQSTEEVSIGGFNALQVSGAYLNVADSDYGAWKDHDTIDVLVQFYGNEAVLDARGNPRNFHFLVGTLPFSELAFPLGGQIPAEGKNRQWNWMLFRIENGSRPSDGAHFLGTLPPNSTGANNNGGVNGGTIRMEVVTGLTIRAIAFGEEGAFGEPERVNRFAAAEACAKEPNTNLAWIDFHKNQADHLQLLNAGDQTSEIRDGIGPANDKRRAARALGRHMNFGVTDKYLGDGCNEPRTVKICVEYYDDPALKGKTLGPDAYATDDKGGISSFKEERRKATKGKGAWVKLAFVVPGVSLAGVNTRPLTGGPRLLFDEGGNFWISRFDVAVLRVGEHPLAGIDPLALCFEDPDLCDGVYGNYAELDLSKGVQLGLAPGGSGGDQEMIQEEAGPKNDRRQAIRNAGNDGGAGFDHVYLNFAIQDEIFGPSSQPPTRFAICATYWDNPAMEGASFRPEVYRTDRNGRVDFAFTPGRYAVRLEGTDTWREAYWEIDDMGFHGVNQGPQAAARFATSGSAHKIHITRLRYTVIRPCGPSAGLNPLAPCKPRISAARLDKNVRLSWPTNTPWRLEESADLKTWSASGATPEAQAGLNILDAPVTPNRFFRLAR